MFLPEKGQLRSRTLHKQTLVSSSLSLVAGESRSSISAPVSRTRSIIQSTEMLLSRRTNPFGMEPSDDSDMEFVG